MSPQLQRVVVVTGIGLFLIGLIGVPIGIYFSAKKPNPESGGAAPSAVFVKSPGELEGATGKTVKLTGRVKEITTRRPDGVPLVFLSWGNSTTVYCEFPKQDSLPDWFRVTEVGQEFTVAGRVKELNPGSVDLDSCQRIGR